MSHRRHSPARSDPRRASPTSRSGRGRRLQPRSISADLGCTSGLDKPWRPAEGGAEPKRRGDGEEHLRREIGARSREIVRERARSAESVRKGIREIAREGEGGRGGGGEGHPVLDRPERLLDSKAPHSDEQKRGGEREMPEVN